MNWTNIDPANPRTLPPVGVRVLVCEENRFDKWQVAKWMGDDKGWKTILGSTLGIWKHWAIPTPPGTPPAVPAEVKAVLDVCDDLLVGVAVLIGNQPGILDNGEYEHFRDHIDAIRAARAALGMDTKEQQP